MLFDSFQFAIFFPLVCGLFWALPQRWRWLLLLISSYYFYMAWRPAYALVLVVITAIETIRRSRRAHGGFATAMLQSALEQFVPAIVAGGLLTIALLEVAPQDLWMIPGLWHIVFSLGVFASRRFLPRAVFWVGVWFLACGLACLALAAPTHTNSPWAMGIPYGVGHLLVAGILQYRHQAELSR